MTEPKTIYAHMPPFDTLTPGEVVEQVTDVVGEEAIDDARGHLKALTDLTDRQNDVLVMIVEHVRGHHRTPTMTEIADAFDLTTTRAHQIVSRLVELGWLIREGRNYRLARHVVRVEPV